jgi:hypothetical protein
MTNFKDVGYKYKLTVNILVLCFEAMRTRRREREMLSDDTSPQVTSSNAVPLVTRSQVLLQGTKAAICII